MHVPVVSPEQKPLMPTTASRARRWIKEGKATPFWKGHIFCIRLNTKSEEYVQQITAGVDPGSKKEGFTVKSKNHHYLNIQLDAITHVKDVVEARRNMRKGRRFRKTPCRKPRFNRASLKKNRIPPSTKARWQLKLNWLSTLAKIYPISSTCVEDIKAKVKGKRRWDKSFSPLEVGKKWFYSQIENLHTRRGYETKAIRDKLGLKKSEDKMSNDFDAHCVDSYVLAHDVVGGHDVVNRDVLCLTYIKFKRRQLHALQPAKGGVRKNQGGTISLGLKRGSIVKHRSSTKSRSYGTVYVGGTMNGKVSLHCLRTGKRLTQLAKPEDCKFLAYNRFRSNWHKDGARKA